MQKWPHLADEALVAAGQQVHCLAGVHADQLSIHLPAEGEIIRDVSFETIYLLQRMTAEGACAKQRPWDVRRRCQRVFEQLLNICALYMCALAAKQACR